MQVENHALMVSDIENLSDSAPRLERIEFDIDACGVTRATIQDLACMARAALVAPDVRHLFDRDFPITADVHRVANPLKYTVCKSIRPALLNATAAAAAAAATVHMCS